MLTTTTARHLRLAALGVFLAVILHAQTPATPDLTFKARAELVSVPVIVTDKSGAYVHRLTKEDFTLLEEGTQQPISAFEEIVPAHGSTPEPVSADRFSNLQNAVIPARQLTLVVLDLLNTTVSDQIRAKNELLKFLARPENASQPLSVLAVKRSGISLIPRSNLTLTALRAALNDIDRAQQPVTEEPSQIVLTDNTDQLSKILQDFGQFQVGSDQAALSFDRRRAMILTLQSLQQIAFAFAGFPGRKSMVWVSGGFPFTINETSMALKEGSAALDTEANLLPLYQKTWDALNRAQIAIYAVDAHGLGELPGPPTAKVVNPLPDPFMHGQWLHAGSNATLLTFAHATAGRVFLNTNSLLSAIQSAVDDSSSYYLLAYSPRAADKASGWRKLEVRVHREGVQVLARNGFFLSPLPTTEDGSKDSMRAALDAPLDYTAIPITAKWEEVRPDIQRGKKKAIFVLTMPPGFAQVDENNRNRFAFDFWAAARTSAGKLAGDSEQTMEGYFKPDVYERFRSKGTDYRGALSLPPGEYSVRFVVRDRLSGRIGTLTAPLKVAP